MKCIICKTKLTGKQRKFCSKKCKNLGARRRQAKVCCKCGKLKVIQRKNDGSPICKECCNYKNSEQICSICGNLREVNSIKDGAVCRECYMEKYKAPVKKCIECKKIEPVHKNTEHGPLCKKCYRKLYKPPKRKCCGCGNIRVMATKTLCQSCRIKQRCKEDYNFAIRTRLRKKVSKNIRNGKMRNSLVSLINYEEISKHIGPPPRDNYHIDHIFPLVAFDLTNEAHVQAAFSPKNHQWLSETHNCSKKDKYDQELFVAYLSCFLNR